MNATKPRKRIWIDITNSPDVLFFSPIIEEIKKRGNEVYITARDYAQTKDLLKQYGLSATIFGKHQGKNIVKKGLGLLLRTTRLILYAKNKHFSLGASLSSNDLALAAWVLKIPQVTITDYEYATISHKFNFKFVNRVLVPEFLPDDVLKSYGAKPEQIVKYRGLKEQVYLPQWKIDLELPKKIGLDSSKIIIVMRPPATMSLYHRFESELFIECLKTFSARKDTQVILIPRTEEQKAELLKITKNVFIPPPVDGPSLIYASDLVVGGGGTMNREASVLGVPVYTVFKGKLGAIDTKLIEEKKMVQISNPNDVKIEKRSRVPLGKIESNLKEVTEKILETMEIHAQKQ